MVNFRSLTVKAIVLCWVLFFSWVISSLASPPVGTEHREGTDPSPEQRVTAWRKDRDLFFKNHHRSPLLPDDKKRFKGLDYFPIESRYLFAGTLERYLLSIQDPQYYVTFLTNQGTNKRYIRYGKFPFRLDGREVVLEIFKSILSDTLFIPFKDHTNGKETYEGGRYLDAEILSGYRMVLDFNRAYNPSCAYNPKFICALPSRENILPGSVLAGEKRFRSAQKGKNNF